jgi:hypothetical protein
MIDLLMTKFAPRSPQRLEGKTSADQALGVMYCSPEKIRLVIANGKGPDQ